MARCSSASVLELGTSELELEPGKSELELELDRSELELDRSEPEPGTPGPELDRFELEPGRSELELEPGRSQLVQRLDKTALAACRSVGRMPLVMQQQSKRDRFGSCVAHRVHAKLARLLASMPKVWFPLEDECAQR